MRTGSRTNLGYRSENHLKLPSGDVAEVPAAKLVGYLLSESHPVGRSKARVFARLGYTTQNWEALREALLGIARQAEVAETGITPHGIRYTVDGYLERIGEGRVRLRTIWIVRHTGDPPHFVTAFPL